jgi:hypothetical protein
VKGVSRGRPCVWHPARSPGATVSHCLPAAAPADPPRRHASGITTPPLLPTVPHTHTRRTLLVLPRPASRPPPQVGLSFTPIIISNILSGTALSNSATVAASAGSKGLKPVGLSVVPYALAAVVSVLVAISAQRRQEHFFHVAACITLAGVLHMLLPVILTASGVGGFITLALTMAFGAASNPPMMVLSARVCLGNEQAVALPLVNTAVVLGGIIGPPMVGAMLNKLVGCPWSRWEQRETALAGAQQRRACPGIGLHRPPSSPLAVARLTACAPPTTLPRVASPMCLLSSAPWIASRPSSSSSYARGSTGRAACPTAAPTPRTYESSVAPRRARCSGARAGVSAPALGAAAAARCLKPCD